MATLAEKIAAKKAAALLEAQGVSNVRDETVRPESTENVRVLEEAKSLAQSITEVPVQPAAPTTSTRARTQAEADAQAKEEVKQTDATGKPLSGFALMQARKKRATELMSIPIVEEQNEPTDNRRLAAESGNTADEGLAEQPTIQAETPHLQASEGTSSVAEASGEEDEGESEEYANATPEARQAYADIKPRISALVGLMGDDIKSAMADLKSALMKNPNAVQLMLPSDIGQMVIALRKMTGVELAAKAAGKATGTRAKKSKEVALTAEELDKAWEEL